MKKIHLVLLLGLLGVVSARAQSNLPACVGSDVSRWSGCQGTTTYANGNKYTGEFKNGKRNGQGIFALTDGRIWAEGIWADDKFVREERLNQPSPNNLATQQDLRESVRAQSNLPACVGSDVKWWSGCQGTTAYANGNKYTGEFKDGKRNGRGTFTLADGRLWAEGIWADDKFVREERLNQPSPNNLAAQQSGAQPKFDSSWVEEPSIEVHYMRALDGAFIRTLQVQEQTVDAVINLIRGGGASLTLNREVPGVQREVRGYWQLENGEVLITFMNRWTLVGTVVSRNYRSRSNASPPPITGIFVRSTSAPSFMLGDYRQTFGNLEFDPGRHRTLASRLYRDQSNLVPHTPTTALAQSAPPPNERNAPVSIAMQTTDPGNESMANYDSDGYTRNACYDYIIRMYGLYWLAETPANANNLELRRIAGILTRADLEKFVIPKIKKSGLLPAHLQAAPPYSPYEAMGIIGMQVHMKTNNNNIDGYMSSLETTGKLCMAANGRAERIAASKASAPASPPPSPPALAAERSVSQASRKYMQMFVCSGEFNYGGVAESLADVLIQHLSEGSDLAYGQILSSSSRYFSGSTVSGGCYSHGFSITRPPANSQKIKGIDKNEASYSIYKTQGLLGVAYIGIIERK